MTTASGRSERSYHVFMGARPALGVVARPGHLYSRAALPEGMTAPTHPFIDGVSHDPLYEHRLRQLLLASSDFDDFVRRLVDDGFDVASNRGESVWTLRQEPRRLMRSGQVIAAMWPCEGQLSATTWQPEPDVDVYPHALVTAYVPELIDELRSALQATTRFDALVARLELPL